MAGAAPRLHGKAAGAYHDKAENLVKPTDCVRHPGVPVDARDDYYCTDCYIKAWNQGADWADKHWADDPEPAIEYTPYGEIISPFDRYSNKQHTINRSKEK